MLKKLLVASACMMAFANGGFAEKLTQTPVNLEIYGAAEAYYKMQNDYRALLDSSDYQEALGNDWSSGANYRSGANNRSHQTARAGGSLTMVARSGENDYNGKPWYSLIGVMKLEMDVNDPDFDDGESKDGAMHDDVSLGDVWMRYSPAIMVGIKVGSQTVAATANMYGIGYSFAGDFDGDFVYWTAAVLSAKPGISVDLHLGDGLELGAGLFQGMGDFSAIVSGGSNEQANNAVVWLDGKFGFIDVLIGNQTVSVGGTDGSVDPSGDVDEEVIINRWQHESTHSLINLMFKVNIGGFSPFIAYQSASGEKIAGFDDGQFTEYNGAVSAYSFLGIYGITPPSTKREVSLTTSTIGLVSDVGPGKLAFEYSTIDTPDWGEDAMVTIGIEAKSSTHLNYQYPITENASLVLFYNSTETKESDVLRENISILKKNAEILDGLGLTSYAAQSRIFANNLATFAQTSTTSVGLSIKMRFGN